MARRLEGKPFHLVATHRQNNPREQVVAYIKGRKLDPNTPNFSVTSRGRHPKVTGNGYVPYYLVFDHTGKLVQHHMCGAYHGGDGLAFIEWVDRMLEKAPAIYLGEEPFVEARDLAAKVSAKQSLAATVKKVEAELAGGNAGNTGARAAELERLLAAVEAYRDRSIQSALRLEATRPDAVLPALRELAKELKGTERAVPVAARIEELEGSADWKRAIAAQKKFEKVRRSLQRCKCCKACKKSGFESLRLDCGGCRKANRNALKKAEKSLASLSADCGGLPIEATIQALLDEVRSG